MEYECRRRPSALSESRQTSFHSNKNLHFENEAVCASTSFYHKIGAESALPYIPKTEERLSSYPKGIFHEYPRSGVLGGIFRFYQPTRRKTAALGVKGTRAWQYKRSTVLDKSRQELRAGARRRAKAPSALPDSTHEKVIP